MMKLPFSGSCWSRTERLWLIFLNNGLLILVLFLSGPIFAAGPSDVSFAPGASPLRPSAMPLISRGVPVFASGTAPYLSPTAANDDNHQSMWVSDAVPAWLAYDLSRVPLNQRQQVLVAWYASWAIGYIYNNPTADLYMPVNYVIETNSANGGSSAPSTGWQVAVTVTGNNRGSRQHLINLAGANWVRFRATSSSNPTAFAIDMDIHAAPDGASDCWLFMGDSISGVAAYLFSDIPSQVNKLMPGRWPVVVSAFIGGSNAWSANEVIDDALSTFPGRFVTLNYGTNLGPEGFGAAMEVLVQKVFAAGKIPVIPHMPWSGLNEWVTKGPLINGQIDALYSKYPAIFRGPDLWTAFYGRTDLISNNDVHPNDAGNAELRRQWAIAIADIIPPNEAIVTITVGD